MSENENAFLKSMKKQNWTFVIVEILIFVFFVGVTYARVNSTEIKTENNARNIERNELKLETKVSRAEVQEFKQEIKDYNKDMKSDLLKAIDDLKKEVRAIK